jgi:hypothetical protein
VRFGAVIKFLSALILFVFFFISFLQVPLNNYDFWWHLATGKYIAENKSLPQSDPFSYTTDDTSSDRKSIILKGYWLAQIIFYEVFSLWDVKGIIIIRSLLMLLFLFFVFLNIKKRTSSDLISLIFVTIVFLVAVPYGADRPQLFTFLIFALIYYLLEDFRTNRSKKVFLIPLFVILLSNMHPGYIVCLLLVSLYLFAHIFHYFVKRDEDTGFFKIVMILWILTVFSAALNPTGLSVFKELFSIEKHTESVIEFMPTFYLFSKKLTPVSYPYILFLILPLLMLWDFKKIEPRHILLLIVFAAMSLFSIRYVIFYMCIAAPILARITINLGEKKIFTKLSRVLREKNNFIYVVPCLIGIFLVFYSLPALARYEFKADTASSVPQGAADFLCRLKIKGNMFNDYGFGGYLIWRLHPDKKVFIDGRLLEPDVYDEYRMVISTKKDQSQSWEDIIRKYNISYIIMPPLSYHGQIYPVVEKLFDSNEWVLIYCDPLSLIFLSRQPENMSVIKEHAIDKKEMLNTIISQALAGVKNDRVNPYFLISLGKVLLKMGKFDDAEKAFWSAYERDPGNSEVKYWLQIIRERRK